MDRLSNRLFMVYNLFMVCFRSALTAWPLTSSIGSASCGVSSSQLISFSVKKQEFSEIHISQTNPIKYTWHDMSTCWIYRNWVYAVYVGRLYVFTSQKDRPQTTWNCFWFLQWSDSCEICILRSFISDAGRDEVNWSPSYHCPHLSLMQFLLIYQTSPCLINKQLFCSWSHKRHSLTGQSCCHN